MRTSFFFCTFAALYMSLPMKLLLIILSIMTFTVKDKNNVTPTGTFPSDMQVSYHSTYQKGTARAGDTITLSLQNLGGIAIGDMKVYVRSNKDGGAGAFTVTANGEVKATKSGSLADWFGAYDNQSFHALQLLPQGINSINTLDIRLIGSANSLYVEKYEITYSPAEAHTVTLMCGNRVFSTLYEESGMAGVILPSVADSAEWKFRGWSETELWTTYELPHLWLANEKYHPSTDCTLWAVFEYDNTPKVAYVTELQTGVYQYVNRTLNIALTSVPYEDGTMDFAPIDASDADQLYEVRFAAPDTAYITHRATGTPIGYAGKNMAVKASPWLVYHNEEETVFYTMIGTQSYVLWLNIMDGNGENEHAGLRTGTVGNSSGHSPMALQVPSEKSDPYYTCHPEVPQGIEQVNTERLNGEWIVPFGIYELHIKNGYKELRLR